MLPLSDVWCTSLRDITKPHVRVFTVATSLLYVVERLGIIAKQAALQFVDSLRTDIRMGSDAFCVRLLLSTTGDVKDVQLYHGIGVRDLHTGHVTESRVGRLVTHRRSVAKRGGCSQRRLFVSLFVRMITSERLNVDDETWRLGALYKILARVQIWGSKVRVTRDKKNC